MSPKSSIFATADPRTCPLPCKDIRRTSVTTRCPRWKSGQFSIIRTTSNGAHAKAYTNGHSHFAKSHKDKAKERVLYTRPHSIRNIIPLELHFHQESGFIRNKILRNTISTGIGIRQEPRGERQPQVYTKAWAIYLLRMIGSPEPQRSNKGPRLSSFTDRPSAKPSNWLARKHPIESRRNPVALTNLKMYYSK